MSPEKDGKSKALPKALVQDEEVGMPNAAGKKQPGNYLLLAGFLMSVALVSIFANAGLFRSSPTPTAATPSSRRALSTFEDAFDGEPPAPQRHPLRQLGEKCLFCGNSGATPKPAPPPLPPSPSPPQPSPPPPCYSVDDACLAECAPSSCPGNLVCVQTEKAGFWNVQGPGKCQAIDDCDPDYDDDCT